jgi:DNA-binding IclR family transcriptional regulator
VREVARPHRSALRAATSETVHLLMLEGAWVRFIDGLESPRALRVGSRTGLRLPAYATSGGKALLAQLDDAVVAALYPSSLRQITSQTVADRPGLLAELERVRTVGYATNFGESESRVSGVAACVIGPAGRPVAALAVAAPSERLTADVIPEVAKQVVRVVQEFATSLGGSGGGMTITASAKRLLA